MNPEEFETMATALYTTLDALCAEHHIAPVPLLEWSPRMRRQLGRAYPSLNVIRLSLWLDEHQANETMRHELAHIASGTQHQAPHGPKWQAWAVRLGVSPRATSPIGPTLAPEVEDYRLYYGLECAGCGVRVARMRVVRGLYHRDCGQQRGTLRKVIRGGREDVLQWVDERKERAGTEQDGPAPPAPAPPIDNRRYLGAECAGCGARFIRLRMASGLYHPECGPVRGRLRRAVQGGRDGVLKWVAERNSTNGAGGT